VTLTSPHILITEPDLDILNMYLQTYGIRQMVLETVNQCAFMQNVSVILTFATMTLKT